MSIIKINDHISYIEASENPLSADIGVIKDGGEALAAATCGGGIGIRIGSAWRLSWRPS